MTEVPTTAPTGYATGGVIPYKNPAALMAYYCGVFSLVPCMGILVGIPGIVLGVIGLRNRKATPVIRGGVHAWIGIVLGSVTTLLWGSMILFMIIGMLSAR